MKKRRNKILTNPIKSLFIVLLSLLSFLSPQTFGRSFKTEQAQHSQGEIVLMQEGFAPGQTLYLGLFIQLDKDWHTYWKNPGDTGAPIFTDWKIPETWNLEPRQDPIPLRISTPPLVTFGYKDSVLLIQPIKIPQNEQRSQVLIDLEAEWLVCDDVCIPVVETLRIELFREGFEGPKNYQSQIRPELFQKFEAQLPVQWADLEVDIEWRESQYELRLQNIHEGFEVIDFLPLSKNLVSNGQPSITRVPSQNWLLTGNLSKRLKTSPSSLKGVLLVQSKDSEQVIGLSIETPSASTKEKSAWLLFLVMAFLGGLILNLMPCVFPVISIKMLSILQAKSKSSDDFSKSLPIGHWPYTIGVLTSFWLLATVLVLLRAGGESLGWGFQLQSPWFVVCLIWVFWLLGFSLFGILNFNIWVPQSLSLKKSWPPFLQHFWSGVLSTVVASPCTAPFMGAALGFALAQPYWMMMAIFTALGLGLAFPYLLLGWFPDLARWLPRPGPWMNTLKQFMAFPMWATVIWLLWVLAFQVSPTSLSMVLAGLLVLSLALWIQFKQPEKKTVSARRLTILLVAVSLYLSFGFLKQTTEIQNSNSTEAKQAWQPFSQQTLDRLLQTDQPIFIDFTAAWCITCQLNKQTTLERGEILELFKERNVHLLRGDWTKRDPEITKILQVHNRAGVPMYLFYPEGGKQQPIVLPEILTPALIHNLFQ